jgi:hypothetical protein
MAVRWSFELLAL